QVLAENIYKLQKFYFDNGFFDTKIDTSVKYDHVEEEVFIEIIVKEKKEGNLALINLIFLTIGLCISLPFCLR
ncbi:MAG: hypothetical protein ABI892_14570, partial [Flavobacterium sp.]